VSVTDTGIGIPATEIPRIFEKFTQIGDTLTGKPDGTGLGLSICKGIIEHYSGHIWVESEPDTGSTFSFALPAILTQAEATRRADQAIAE
jgi:signal transduction histidine kinase